MEIKEAIRISRDLAKFLRRCAERSSMFTDAYGAEAEAVDVICNALEAAGEQED